MFLNVFGRSASRASGARSFHQERQLPQISDHLTVIDLVADLCVSSMVLNRCLHGVVSCWAFEAESWAKVVRHSCDYLHSLGAPINFDASRFVSQFGETQRQFLIFWDCSTFLNSWLDSSSIVAGLWDALCLEGHTVSVVFECTTVTHEQKATLDGWGLSRVEVDKKSFTSLQHSTVFWTTHDGLGSDFVE